MIARETITSRSVKPQVDRLALFKVLYLDGVALSISITVFRFRVSGVRLPQSNCT